MVKHDPFAALSPPKEKRKSFLSQVITNPDASSSPFRSNSTRSHRSSDRPSDIHVPSSLKSKTPRAFTRSFSQNKPAFAQTDTIKSTFSDDSHFLQETGSGLTTNKLNQQQTTKNHEIDTHTLTSTQKSIPESKTSNLSSTSSANVPPPLVAAITSNLLNTTNPKTPIIHDDEVLLHDSQRAIPPNASAIDKYENDNPNQDTTTVHHSPSSSTSHEKSPNTNNHIDNHIDSRIDNRIDNDNIDDTHIDDTVIITKKYDDQEPIPEKPQTSKTIDQLNDLQYNSNEPIDLGAGLKQPKGKIYLIAQNRLKPIFSKIDSNSKLYHQQNAESSSEKKKTKLIKHQNKLEKISSKNQKKLEKIQSNYDDKIKQIQLQIDQIEKNIKIHKENHVFFLNNAKEEHEFKIKQIEENFEFEKNLIIQQADQLNLKLQENKRSHMKAKQLAQYDISILNRNIGNLHTKNKELILQSKQLNEVLISKREYLTKLNHLQQENEKKIFESNNEPNEYSNQIDITTKPVQTSETDEILSEAPKESKDPVVETDVYEKNNENHTQSSSKNSTGTNLVIDNEKNTKEIEITKSEISDLEKKIGTIEEEIRVNEDQIGNDRNKIQEIEIKESQRLEREKAEREKLEKLERERLEREAIEAEQLKREDEQRVAQERLNSERKLKEQQEAIEKERIEQERREKQRFEKEEKRKVMSQINVDGDKNKEILKKFKYPDVPAPEPASDSEHEYVYEWKEVAPSTTLAPSDSIIKFETVRPKGKK
ncbi:uncharacterized protein ASCRUDRAFT_153277 [Ascoidea rubescens DSM 1968]|uniref:Uncharacterized protein n=1 Tax=Ascoidea rubescens DSM 1968 TaxID=1344418 RepID=A0A1D2VFN4_9ASCO|nr:hypothetical protein ASCRUDRAFT_153277 [Ascoidea rubescens DSM 1968]ODV60330.1 hypothetical protein ASCRUDRAFT_153277 [Ascoidea rubescens DSM 1968]